MPAATKSRTTRNAPRERKTTNKGGSFKSTPLVKSTTKTKATAKAKPVVKTVAQRSVTVHCDRGDAPKGNGGQRFNERGDGPYTLRAVYVDQAVDAKLGSPDAIVVLVTAA